MKKLLLFTMSILLCILCIKIPINASNEEGLNLVNPNLFSSVDFESPIYGNYGQLQVGESDFISIKSDTEYFFLPTYTNKLDTLEIFDWSCLPFFSTSPSISLYDSNKTYLSKTYLPKNLTSEGVLVGYAFSLPSDVSFIKFNAFKLVSTFVTASEFSLFYETFCNRLDAALLLIEADNIMHIPSNTLFNYNLVKGMSSYDISGLYLGEDLDFYCYDNINSNPLSIVTNANEYYYKTSVDNPISLSGLKEALQIKAYDEIDGDISDSIIITSSEYLSKVYDQLDIKARSLGTYDIVFTVSDLAGNNASMIVKLIVEDTLSPSLKMDSSTTSYTKEVTEPALSIEFIKANITVVDNYSDVSIVEVIDNYTENSDKLGTYYVDIVYQDSSNNELTVRVSISNEDTIAPLITLNSEEIRVSYTCVKSITSLLANLEISVYDTYDGELNYSITSDAYSINSRRIGTYPVIISANDNSGNTSEKTILIKVIDDVDPIFYINDNVIIVKVGAYFSETDLVNLIKLQNLNKFEDFSIETIQDNFSANKDNVGNYEMVLRLNYSNGEVSEERLLFCVESIKETPRLSFFAKIYLGIKKIFQWIWNIIKWPIKKLISFF